MKTFNFGLIAEYFITFIYILKFYQILHHRIRNYGGEVDIVAIRGKTLVFIEVKARKSDYDDVLLSQYQQRRIKKAAEIFISKNSKYKSHDIRFDFVVVKPYMLPLIIKNAW